MQKWQLTFNNPGQECTVYRSLAPRRRTLRPGRSCESHIKSVNLWWSNELLSSVALPFPILKTHVKVMFLENKNYLPSLWMQSNSHYKQWKIPLELARPIYDFLCDCLFLSSTCHVSNLRLLGKKVMQADHGKAKNWTQFSCFLSQHLPSPRSFFLLMWARFTRLDCYFDIHTVHYPLSVSSLTKLVINKLPKYKAFCSWNMHFQNEEISVSHLKEYLKEFMGSCLA